MAMTPKQDRNGVPGPVETRNTAQPGLSAEADIRSAMATAQAAADARKRQAHEFMASPAGSGPTGSNVLPGRVIANPGGTVWQWDAGLAINDVEGGGSG